MRKQAHSGDRLCATAVQQGMHALMQAVDGPTQPQPLTSLRRGDMYCKGYFNLPAGCCFTNTSITACYISLQKSPHAGVRTKHRYAALLR